MPWLECKKHPSVYYDSTIHKRCPACLNESLEQTAKKFVTFAFDSYLYATILLKWFGLELQAISPTSMSKEEAISKKEPMYQQLKKSSLKITHDLVEMVEHYKRNNFKENVRILDSALSKEKVSFTNEDPSLLSVKEKSKMGSGFGNTCLKSVDESKNR